MNDPLGLFEEENSNDPLGLFSEDKPKMSFGQNIKRSLMGASTAVDKAISLPAGALASVFSEEEGDRVFREMDDRERRRMAEFQGYADPSLSSDLGAMALTLPAQVLALPGQAAVKGTDLIQRGESLPTAMGATAFDALANAAGMGPMAAAKTFAGRAGIGAVGNVAFGAGSDAATQLLAQQQDTKDAYDPYDPRRRAMDALAGGAMQGVFGERPSAPLQRPLQMQQPAAPVQPAVEGPAPGAGAFNEMAQRLVPPQYSPVDFPSNNPFEGMAEQLQGMSARDRANAVDQILAQRKAELELQVKRQTELDLQAARIARQEAAPAVSTEALQAMRAAEDARLAQASRQQQGMQQMEIDDTPFVLPDTNQVIAPQFGAMQGVGRIDENGMPIRADLSMEAANLENPLQRNLFGDELGPAQGQKRSLTAAIDMMPEGIQNRGADGRMTRGTTRQSALDRLRGEIPASPELEAAKVQADLDAALAATQPATGPKKYSKKQRGVINETLLTFGVSKLIDMMRAKGTDQPMRRIMGAFDGTFKRESLVDAYNQSLDPKSRERVYLMSPDEFLALAKRRMPWDMNSKESTDKRTSVEQGLKTKEGLNDIPYLIINGEGQVIGHEGRHRSDVLSGKLDKIPVRIKSLVHRNEDGPLPFTRLKAQDEDGFPSTFGQPLITPDNRAQHQYANSKTTQGTKSPSFNFKKQGGGLLINPKETTQIANSLVKSSDGSFIPANPDVAVAIEAAKKMGKDGKQWNLVQSGSTSVAMKNQSPIVLAASRIVQNATKRAELMTRNVIFPVEKAIQQMSRDELMSLGNIMKQEMFAGQRADPTQLIERLSVKQLEAYTKLRDMFDKALDAQNEARLAKGQEPISPNEAYMSSRWQGDFRKKIYDAEGKVVWALAANTRMGLEAQVKALKKLKPDLVYDEKVSIVRSGGSKTDIQSAYSTMLDILGRDNAAVADIKAALEADIVANGEFALAQEKHFKTKTGVRGFVGDRPGEGGSFKETLSMFQEQIQYAKNAFKWSELQAAAEAIKPILSDEDLQSTQPNNIEYVREYFSNALGIGEAKVMRVLGDNIREGLGISPNILNNAVGNMKNFFITQKLVLSAGYMASNLVQASQVLPYLVDLRANGIKGNPITALSTGLFGGPVMTMSHYMGSMGQSYVEALPTQFLKEAIRYAEDNGVTFRSVYDEAPIDQGFNPVIKYGLKPAQAITNSAETMVRSVAFLTYAQFLESSGQFKNKSEMFQMAEELVNKSMVDYRETERPLVFSKLGTAGNALNTLQTFPVSFYNQYAYMMKQAKDGSPMPLITMLATHYLIAGAMGLPGFDDMDKLWKYIKDEALPTDMWNTINKNPFLSDPRAWMIDNMGESSVYGLLSTESGIAMTSRVSAPGAGAMLQSPVGPISDIAGQVGSVASALKDPSNTSKMAQAALKVAPVGFQGLLETAPFMEGITYTTREDGTKVFMKNSDLTDRSGTYSRTPKEVDVRKFGVRSQKEVATRDVMYGAQSANQSLTRRSGELIDRWYDSIRRGDLESANNIQLLYTDLTGKTFSDLQFTNQAKEEFFTEIEKQVETNKTSPRKLLNTVRAIKLLEERK